MKNLYHYLNVLIFCSFIALLSSDVVIAQTVWNSTSSLNIPRQGHISVAYNGYLYVIGGTTDDVTRYNLVQFAPINADGSLGTWQTTTPFMNGRRGHTSVAYNGNLYVMGGTPSGGGLLNDVQFAPIHADGSIGAWQFTVPFNYGRLSHSSVVYNGYLYVIQGFSGSAANPLPDIQRAYIFPNGSLSGWQNVASFVPPRWGHKSVAYNGFIYSLGGSNYNGSYYTLNNAQYTAVYPDGSLGGWQNTTTFSPSVDGPGLVQYNGYLVLAGGYNIPSGCVNEVKFARINPNGTLRSWQTTMSPYEPNRSSNGVAEYNGYLYISGGVDAGSVVLGDVLYAKIDLPPEAPGSLTATQGYQEIALNWNSNNEDDFLHYNIYAGTTPNPTNLVRTTEDGNQNANSVTVAGLQNGTTYYFRVTTVDNAAFESEFSNEVVANTLPPLTGEYVDDEYTIGLWHLNETTGASAYDFSGNENIGSITGTTVGGGQYGNAREFYTASDQISIPDDESLNFGTGPYTIEFWVKAPPNSGGHPMHKRGNSTLGTTGRGWFTNIENNKIAISLYNDPTLDGEAGYSGLMSIRDIADNTWHHVAFVNTYETILCYIDGFLDNQASIAWQGSSDNDCILDIGISSHTGEFLGALDEIRISNKARTPDEFGVNPGIQVTSPNGGETWHAGTEQTIYWSSLGTSGSMTIEYSDNNGNNWIVIEAITPDDGSYSWETPNVPGAEYLIRVTDSDGDPSDVSNQVFSILDPNNPVISNPHVNSYHDLFPGGNEQYGFEVSVSVFDPQGSGDIASVTVTTPNNVVYTLLDDGQHGDGGQGDGIYGINILLGPQVPALGNYAFTVTDYSNNSISIGDVLDHVLDVPANMNPSNNSIVSTANPMLSWDAVPGAPVYWIEVFDNNYNMVWGRYNITTPSVQYNDDNNGASLIEGQFYKWQLQAQFDDGRSWHAPLTFVYSSSTVNPVITNQLVKSRHRNCMST
jgi:hypothetical protein